MKCTHCNEGHPNPIYFSLDHVMDLEDSRGKATYVAKCSFCKRQQHVTFIDGSLKAYEQAESYQTVAKFECR